MKIKFGLNTKMLLFILLTAITIFIGAIGYISYMFKNTSLKNARIIADNYAKEYAYLTTAKLNEYMIAARTIASEIEAYYALPEDKRRVYFSDILVEVLERNEDFISVWSICEPNTIDTLDTQFVNTLGSTFMGNFSPTYYKDKGEIKIMGSTDTVLFQGDYYTVPKSTGNETILDPYYYSYTGDEADAVLETNLIVPVRNTDDEFIGVVGIDVTLNIFVQMIQQIKPFGKGFAYLISNNGTIVAHPDSSLSGDAIDSMKGFKYYPEIIKNKIQIGESHSFTLKDKNRDGKDYVTFVPILIGKSTTPWSVAISVPVSTIMSKANNSFAFALIIGLVGLILLTLVIWLIAGNITKPILKTTQLLEKLSKGEIDKNNVLDIKSQDEIGEMAESVNTLIEGLVETASFANEIGKGNLETEFKLLSEKDVLGSSLIEMRKSLVLAKKEEELGKIEDQKRNWATQGMAKFGELLRENNDNMEELSYIIIRNLSKYIDASQCAFFILNNETPSDVHFELISTIAYNRRKYITKRVEIGESLVGRSAEEGNTIYLTNLPDDYIEITTGISGEKPKYILIVPLKINDIVYGILELISFNAFEDYQIEFVEKIGESIASTVSGVKTSVRTSQLLEQSKKQADELAQQEEEMRQNMEEMQATQEEAAKREAEMKGLINGIDTTTLVAEYDLDGQIVRINDELLKLYGLADHQVLGKYHGSLTIDGQADKEELEQLWNDLRKGKTRERKHKLIINNREIWLKEVYTPIFDNEGDPIKVLNVSTDVTEIMQMQLEIEQIEAEIKEIQENK